MRIFKLIFLLLPVICLAQNNSTPARGSEGVDLRQDASTWALTTVTYAHHEIHDGSGFKSCDLQNINADTVKWMIVTPNSTKYAHMLFDVECTGEMYVKVTGGADRTAGTAVATINRNQSGTPGASTVTISRTPTSGTTDGATVLVNRRVGATGVGNKTLASGGARGNNEFVLKANTKYIVRVITYANVWVSMDLDWYEHTDK